MKRICANCGKRIGQIRVAVKIDRGASSTKYASFCSLRCCIGKLTEILKAAEEKAAKEGEQ